MAKKANKKKPKKIEKKSDEKNKKIKTTKATKKEQKIKSQINKTKSGKKKKSSKNTKKDDKKECKKEDNKEEKQENKKTEKVAVTNGEVELDQAVEEVDRYIIVPAKPSEYEDKYYAVTLNYTNVKNNNNKFYIIQLLQDKYTQQYGVLYRWGRVGRFGQVNYVTYKNFDEARLAFLTKLEHKILYGYIKIKTEAKIKKNTNDDDNKNDDRLEKHLAN